jgi:hypothetical protein
VLSERAWNNLALALDSRPANSGSPSDPIDEDPDDIGGRGLAGMNGAGLGQSDGGAPQASNALRSQILPSSSQGRGVRLGRTADVANDMIKALKAQGGMQALHGGESKTSQIQLQDGTLWSLSSLDRTMAALSSNAQSGSARASKGATAFGSADLAHAQLIDAMASFSPQASAQSGLPPVDSEAYAIALAVQAH